MSFHQRPSSSSSSSPHIHRSQTWRLSKLSKHSTQSTRTPEASHLVNLGLLSPHSRHPSISAGQSSDHSGQIRRPSLGPAIEPPRGSDSHARHWSLRRKSKAKVQAHTSDLTPRPTTTQLDTIQHSPPRSASAHRSRAVLPFEDELGTMIEATGPKSRRERTFIGSECAVCDEPMEHTLRGERILQMTCSHVAHEACFYEYIKEFESQECPTCDAPLGIDTSRGGGLNFEKLNNLVRSVQTPNPYDRPRDTLKAPSTYGRDTLKTPTPWEDHRKTPTPTPWETETLRHDARSAHDGRSVHDGRSTYEARPVHDSRSTYEARQAHDSRSTYEARPAHDSRSAYETRPAHDSRSAYETRPLPAHDSRSAHAHDSRSPYDTRPAYEARSHEARSAHSQHTSDRDSRSRNQAREPSHTQPRERSLKYSSESAQHARNDSGATGGGHSSADYVEPQQANSRRHDYDVQSMESSIVPRDMPKNPIPAPTVTVRTEFPTLNRSRQQQSLTCLVTIEVVDGKWRPDPNDIRSPPPVFPHDNADNLSQPQTPDRPRHLDIPREHPDLLASVSEDLRTKVDNWHGLDFARFGKLVLFGTIRVGKDRQSWQDLECFLFTEMLICIKEKKVAHQQPWDSMSDAPKVKAKCTLKGSILIKRHLKKVDVQPELDVLTLSLSVAELPHFHLQFHDKTQMDVWRRALVNIDLLDMPHDDADLYHSGADDDDDIATTASGRGRRMSSSVRSSYAASRSNCTAPTEYTNTRSRPPPASRIPVSMHVPLDIVVVVPVTSSMQGLKISLLRDVLRFLVSNIGDQDRMGLVTFGSNGGSMPIVGMTSKAWVGWSKVLETIKPVGQKSLRADVVDGANVAMDLLMQRKSSNPLSSILLISDSATSDTESVDFVVSRAEAAKISIHSFGLGLTHKPDTMIELSTRTKATYTYVKDWMMLRECVAGCLGSMQSISHHNAKLKLRLPEGSPAKFVKISGALQITKRATGKDAEASLGDLRFGDKRDILVQLAITPDSATPEVLPQDSWENIISGLEALGGPLDHDDMRRVSVEEVPLIQADLLWGDILREGNVTQLPRPSLLAITLLPPISRKASVASLTRSSTPAIPPHPSVVQRRMELLTSDMLTRALTLVSKGQHERACHLLIETRSILKGLGKGGLPPLPPPPSARLPPTPTMHSSERCPPLDPLPPTPIEARRTPSPPRFEPLTPFTPAAGIDAVTVTALDAELESALEWINHPAVFGRDSRKAVLQAIGVISSQRGYTFRTAVEGIWAARIPGTKKLADRSREWREGGDEMLREEV